MSIKDDRLAFQVKHCKDLIMLNVSQLAPEGNFYQSFYLDLDEAKALGTKLSEAIAEQERRASKALGFDVTQCCACGGSGWYDKTDKKGRSIKCGACGGTGRIK